MSGDAGKAGVPPADPHDGQRSVLATLASKGRLATYVQLRQDSTGGGTAPVQTPIGVRLKGDEGRYEVLGEVARGGVGIIMKSRDVDLGRDVAMKVIREEHKGNEDVLQRFIEEAQIGGQLQHPGIAPVYEMGLQADGRPFFTMKLIKGRTLAAILSERRDPSEDRRRLIGIFASVCHTLAYAHARGVVHRDLKPSNVMVGAFGEVQVVDWGLAKVIQQGGEADEQRTRTAPKQNLTVIATVRSETAASHSLVGSVMGTPAYMPPEQARGEVGQLDQRSDVFSLGAILCEILTGHPPYAGTDDEMVAAAARADLTQARGRLAECGADPRLVTLAEACLSPAAMARPGDAGAVAKEVSAAISEAEETAHQATLEVARARVRIAEARRARKLTTAIAVSVLGTMLAGGGGTLWVLQGRRERSEAIRLEVDRALEEAAFHRGRAAPSGGEGAWVEAIQAARRAETLARSGDAEPGMLEEVSVVLADLEGGQETALLEARDRALDASMEEALDAIRLESWDLDPAMREARYGAAFREYGIDPDSLSVEEAVAAVRSKPIRERLVPALDSWAGNRRSAGFPEGNLSAIARAADDDPWRRRLREARSPDDLRALARTADFAALPLESLAGLAVALEAGGDAEGAVSLAERILERHPGDLATLTQCAVWMIDLRIPRVSDAVRYAEAAVAVRPGSSGARANLGFVLWQAGRREEAEEALEEAARLNPENATAHWYAGRFLREQGATVAAIERLRKAVALKPDLADAWSNLGLALQADGDLPGALEAMTRGVTLEERSSRAHRQLGDLYKALHDRGRAAAEYLDAARLDPSAPEPHVSLTLLHYEQFELEEALDRAREVVRLRPSLLTGRLNLAFILDDIGLHDEAIGTLRGALRLDPADTNIHTLLARILRGLGDLEGAEREQRVATILSASGSTQINLDLAALLVQKGELDGALNVLKQQLTTAPSPAVRRQLGRALQAKGQFTRAAAEFRRAAEASPGRAAERDRLRAERAAELGPWLRDLLEGKRSPEGAGESLDWARLLYARQFYGRSAELYGAAFSLDPSLAADRVEGDRYGAACAAALASGRQGGDAADLSPERRAAMRRLALGFLRDELEMWKGLMKEDTAAFADPVRRTLTWWMDDPELAFVRSPAQLAALDPGERGAWKALWEEVAAHQTEARRFLSGLLKGGAEGLPALVGVIGAPDFSGNGDVYMSVVARLKGAPHGPEQAAGPPDSRISLAAPTVWRAGRADGGVVTLEVDFSEAVEPEQIRILELGIPGALFRVEALVDGGEWKEIWKGTAGAAGRSRWNTLEIIPTGVVAATYRLSLDTDAAPGWNEIDAVLLVGGGRQQWASAVRASSNYRCP